MDVRLWQQILLLCGLSLRLRNSEVELAWAAKHLKGKTLLSIILGVAWNAYICIIYGERNARFHRKRSQSMTKFCRTFFFSSRIALSKTTNVRRDYVNIMLNRNFSLQDYLFNCINSI